MNRREKRTISCHTLIKYRLLKEEKKQLHGLCLILTSVIFPFLTQAYANVLKANMDGLKKRDKKSAKGKSKAKAI